MSIKYPTVLELLQKLKGKPKQLAFLGTGLGSLLVISYLRSKGKKKTYDETRKGLFYKRLKKILPIIIPSYRSKETAYIAALAILLSSRTYLSGVIAEYTGTAAQNFVAKKWKEASQTIVIFILIAIPAAFVNSALKYVTTILSLQFRVNLSRHIHNHYLQEVTFYNICNLGATKIDNVDQRITSDIRLFSVQISEIFTNTFKPILDIILFTYRLGSVTGWQGPTILYSYFIISGFIKRFLMPSFGRLAEKESKLEGNYRNSHQRLITNSEEVAFYDGSQREKTIINSKLNEIKRHINYTSLLRFLTAMMDNLLVKYWATVAGYLTMSAPIIFGTTGGMSTDELTRDYARNSRYMSSLSDAVGQFVLLGNKLSMLKGYTSRVAELLERVESVTNKLEPFKVQPENPKEYAFLPDNSKFLKEWKERCDQFLASKPQSTSERIIGNVKIRAGKHIQFNHVTIVSPEGKLLIEDLTFLVKQHENVMVTGPNGSGKSSLFRIIGDLWPPNATKDHDDCFITKPTKELILFVPQKPYLVQGTLRDQIIYPHSKQQMMTRGVTDVDLEQLLRLVDPANGIRNAWNWDDEVDWFHAFSGGQKQRVAMARLFYHRPLFAILDECTSAVSDEVEDKIYETCRELGITIFTVSHRKYLRKHHDFELSVAGRGGKWSLKKIEDEKDEE